jgi:probable rRNA maturation factor
VLDVMLRDESEGVDAGALDEAARALSAAAGALGVGACEVSVLLVDDDAMRALNARWRGIDAPTDVLAFAQADEAGGQDAVLGDIVVSVDTARAQAEAMGHPFEAELVVLLVHGLCHLLGFDHDEPAATEAMVDAELRALAAIGARGEMSLVARARLADGSGDA